jgi:hypothetical protein
MQLYTRSENKITPSTKAYEWSRQGESSMPFNNACFTLQAQGLQNLHREKGFFL